MAESNESTHQVYTNTWELPLYDNSGVYPFVEVKKTLGGHTFEVDDTLGSERIHREHKSGSYETFDASGGRVVNVVGTDWKVVAEDSRINIIGNADVTIGAGCNLKITGPVNLDINGDYTVTVHGKARYIYKGGVDHDITGDNSYNINGNYTTKVSGVATKKYESGEKTEVGEYSQTIIGGNIILTAANGAYAMAAQSLSVGCGENINVAANRVGVAALGGKVNVEGTDLIVTEGNVDLLNGDLKTQDVASYNNHRHTETDSITEKPLPS